MRPLLSFVCFFVLFVGACADDAESGFVPSSDCDELADRWITLQQGYLDELADADVAELDQRTPRVTTAESRLGQAMIEQARDAQATGCASYLVSGSPALCTRLDGLTPGGSAGASVVDALHSGCIF